MSCIKGGESADGPHHFPKVRLCIPQPSRMSFLPSNIPFVPVYYQEYTASVMPPGALFIGHTMSRCHQLLNLLCSGRLSTSDFGEHTCLSNHSHDMSFSFSDQ